MNTISVRLPNKLPEEVEASAHNLHVPKVECIRRAIIEMNKKQFLAEHRERLIQVSQRVSEESRTVNAEFELIEQDPGA